MEAAKEDSKEPVVDSTGSEVETSSGEEAGFEESREAPKGADPKSSMSSVDTFDDTLVG